MGMNWFGGFNDSNPYPADCGGFEPVWYLDKADKIIYQCNQDVDILQFIYIYIYITNDEEESDDDELLEFEDGALDPEVRKIHVTFILNKWRKRKVSRICDYKFENVSHMYSKV